MADTPFGTELRRRMQLRTKNEETILAGLAGLAGVGVALTLAAILKAVNLDAVLGPVLVILAIILAVIGGVGLFTFTRIWLRGGRPQPGPAEWPITS